MKKTALFLLLLLFPVMAGCAISRQDQAADLTEGTETTTLLEDGTYKIDTGASTLYWQAYKPIGGHMGGIRMERGELIVADGAPSSGSFVIDMTSITNSDIEDESSRMSLINHLKSDDFFAVADYPTARFDITKVTLYEGDEDYDYAIEGDLSLKDVTDTVTLLTRVDGSGDQLSGYVKGKIDRTKYGITIRSGTFFEELGDKLIKDKFTLEADLVADRL